GKDLAQVGAPVLVVIARHDSANRVDRERARQLRRVTQIAFVIIAPRTLMVRGDADVRVRADRNLLRATKPKRELGIEDEGMIREKFVAQSVVESQTIEIVFGAEN